MKSKTNGTTVSLPLRVYLHVFQKRNYLTYSFSKHSLVINFAFPTIVKLLGSKLERTNSSITELSFALYLYGKGEVNN